MRRAFSELQAAGIAPHVLADVAVGLGKKRGLAIALPLLEGLHDPAPEWRDYIRLATYDLILEKSGKDAALAWVKKSMSDRPEGLVLLLYQNAQVPTCCWACIRKARRARSPPSSAC